MAVVCGRIGDLDPVAAGTALARGIAAHAQVALAPVAAGGPDLAVAVAALTGGEAADRGTGLAGPLAGCRADRLHASRRRRPGRRRPRPPTWGSGSLPASVTRNGSCSTSPASRPTTAGRACSRAAGAALAGRELVGLVAADELDLPATGIGGGLARRAFAGRVDVAELLAADAVLAARAASLGDGLATAPGGGAAGGCGARGPCQRRRAEHRYAVLPPPRGPRRERCAKADLVVTGCTELSALDRGGPVVQAVAGWADEAERPCVLFTTGAGLARRELRTLGLEAAHLLPPGPPTAGRPHRHGCPNRGRVGSGRRKALSRLCGPAEYRPDWAG